MSFFDQLNPWAAIDDIEQQIADAQAAIDQAVAAQAAAQSVPTPTASPTFQDVLSPIPDPNSIQQQFIDAQAALDAAISRQNAAQVVSTPTATNTAPVTNQIDVATGAPSVVTPTAVVTQPVPTPIVQTPPIQQIPVMTTPTPATTLNQADYAYLNPFMINFVATSVQAQLSGKSKQMIQQAELQVIQDLISSNPNVSAYTQAQLLQAGRYFTDQYLGITAPAAGTPLNSISQQTNIPQAVAISPPVQSVIIPPTPTPTPIQPQTVQQIATPIAAAITTQAPDVSSPVVAPDAQPLPLPDVPATSGGFDITGLILVFAFGAALYTGFKKFKQLKLQEGRAKFKNSEFGDGFL